MEGGIRLQKYLAQAGIASRRKAEEYIASGRISVDGQVVTAMGTKVFPGRQRILFDGREVKPAEKLVHILLNKPKGYVTTLSDPQGRPIVTSLLTGVKERVFPVGRLDLDTEGALLLTNDGELSQAILHPSREVFKTYEAEVRGAPSPSALHSLEKGIILDGRKTAPARLKVAEKKRGSTMVIITIHEGRKRQVKKMFQAIGHPVLSLKRLAYGRLELGKLAVGQYRVLSQKELNLIFLK